MSWQPASLCRRRRMRKSMRLRRLCRPECLPACLLASETRAKDYTCTLNNNMCANCLLRRCGAARERVHYAPEIQTSACCECTRHNGGGSALIKETKHHTRTHARTHVGQPLCDVSTTYGTRRIGARLGYSTTVWHNTSDRRSALRTVRCNCTIMWL